MEFKVGERIRLVGRLWGTPSEPYYPGVYEGAVFPVSHNEGGVSWFISPRDGAVSIRPSDFDAELVPSGPNRLQSVAESLGIDRDQEEFQEAVAKLGDPVDHPSHYTSDPSGVECITITRHRSFNIGNAIKYLWRAGLKQDAALEDKAKEIEDLRKAVFYINNQIDLLGG